jgi:hypothetical protein
MVLMYGAQLTAQNHQNKAKTSHSPGIPSTLIDTQDTNRQISSKRWGQMDQYKPRYCRIMVLGARAHIKVQNRRNPAKTRPPPWHFQHINRHAGHKQTDIKQKMGSNGPVQAEIRQNHGFDVGVLKLCSGFGDCECKTKVAKSGVHRNKYLRYRFYANKT